MTKTYAVYLKFQNQTYMVKLYCKNSKNPNDCAQNNLR